jgi:hypothetical protein
MGLSMSQWLYQRKLELSGALTIPLGADMHNIQIDPQLNAGQKLQLENLYGGGPAPQPPHPTGNAVQRIAPISAHGLA